MIEAERHAAVASRRQMTWHRYKPRTFRPVSHLDDRARTRPPRYTSARHGASCCWNTEEQHRVAHRLPSSFLCSTTGDRRASRRQASRALRRSYLFLIFCSAPDGRRASRWQRVGTLRKPHLSCALSVVDDMSTLSHVNRPTAERATRPYTAPRNGRRASRWRQARAPC